MASPAKRQKTTASFSWTEESKLLLLRLCVDFKRCNGIDQAYKWTDIVAKFSEKVQIAVTKDVLMNKFNLVKGDYSLWKKLKNSEIGLGLDHRTGLILADNAWWQRKKRESKAIGRLQYQGFPPEMEELAAYLVDPTIATGGRCVMPRMGSRHSALSSNTQHVDVDEDHREGFSETGHDGIGIDVDLDSSPNDLTQAAVDADITPDSTPLNHCSMDRHGHGSEGFSGTSSKRKSRFASKQDVAIQYMGSYDDALKTVVSIMKQLTPNKPVDSTVTLTPTVQDCIQEMYRLAKLGFLTSGTPVFHYGLTLFRDESQRVTFMSIPEDRDKKGYIEVQYDLLNLGRTRD